MQNSIKIMIISNIFRTILFIQISFLSNVNNIFKYSVRFCNFLFYFAIFYSMLYWSTKFDLKFPMKIKAFNSDDAIFESESLIILNSQEI